MVLGIAQLRRMCAAVVLMLPVVVMVTPPPPVSAQRVPNDDIWTGSWVDVVWSATLTVGEVSRYAGAGCENRIGPARCSDEDVLSDDDFSFAGAEYQIRELYLSIWGRLALDFGSNLPAAADHLVLQVADSKGRFTEGGNRSFAFSNSVDRGSTYRVWTGSRSWGVGDVVDVRLVARKGVTDDARLSSLGFGGVDPLEGEMAWPFHFSGRTYGSEAAVTATPVHADASVVVSANGAVVADGVPVPLALGRNSVDVTVSRGVHEVVHRVSLTRLDPWNLTAFPAVTGVSLAWDERTNNSEVQSWWVYEPGDDGDLRVAVIDKTEVTVLSGLVSYALANDGTDAGNFFWPGTDYEFYIAPCYPVDPKYDDPPDSVCGTPPDHDADSPVVSFTTLTNDHTTVRNLRAQDVHAAAYTLRWDAPAAPSFPVDYYQIYHKEPGGELAFLANVAADAAGDGPGRYIWGLQPDTTYQNTVRPVLTDRAPGTAQTITITTPPAGGI